MLNQKSKKKPIVLSIAAVVIITLLIIAVATGVKLPLVGSSFFAPHPLNNNMDEINIPHNKTFPPDLTNLCLIEEVSATL